MRQHGLQILSRDQIIDATIVLIENADFVDLSLKSEKINVSVKDEYPFFALVKLRLQLEEQGIKILCNGARIDVYPSGNSIVGEQAYELVVGKQATSLVNIFDYTGEIEKISTVEEQKSYRNEWLKSLRV